MSSRPCAAGEDLLLGTADPELIARLSEGLAQAERRRLVDPRVDGCGARSAG